MSNKAPKEKKRIAIPREIRRQLNVESGHKCSVPLCGKSHNLEIHHINGNPSDNNISNLILFCRNHHAMATEGTIDRKECYAYKERLKLIQKSYPTTETLKQKVEREGIDVESENLFVKIILGAGRKYMMWRYGKPDANLKKEIVGLAIIILLCFTPLIFTTLVLKNQITVTSIYLSVGFVFVGSLLLVVFLVIFQRRCTNCGGYFGIDRISSKLVSEEKVETDAKIIFKKVFCNTYRCFFCGNRYSKNEPKEEIISKSDY